MKTDEEYEEMKTSYERACVTIAQMHAAAVGCVRGPTLGVIEDVAETRANMLNYELAYEKLYKEYQKITISLLTEQTNRIKSNIKCDCGAEKSKTTHSNWCSTKG